MHFTTVPAFFFKKMRRGMNQETVTHEKERSPDERQSGKERGEEEDWIRRMQLG